MSDNHLHQYSLAKFTDNSDEAPSTLHESATSDYEWRGVGLFVCYCGLAKSVDYDTSYMIYEKKD